MKTEADGDSETTVAETSLAAKSSTKVSLKVKGDLNSDELAAIQSIFVQSASLADEFFAGDYAAAFEAASGLEIDGQQLAKVSLRFAVRESLTYSGTGLPPMTAKRAQRQIRLPLKSPPQQRQRASQVSGSRQCSSSSTGSLKPSTHRSSLSTQAIPGSSNR